MRWGKLIENEGQAHVVMMAEDGITELGATVQIAKVTRPLLSISKITENGTMHVLCTKDDAKLIEVRTGKVLATFRKKNGLYVAMMRVRNPRWQGFARPGR